MQDLIDKYIDDLPDFLKEATMGDIDIYNGMAVIPFDLEEAIDIEEFMDILEDDLEMTILYHFRPSMSTNFGIQCCAYSGGSVGEVYKIHASTQAQGRVQTVTVTIYESFDLLCSDLISDLDRHENRGRFLSKRGEADVLAEFT